MRIKLRKKYELLDLKKKIIIIIYFTSKYLNAMTDMNFFFRCFVALRVHSSRAMMTSSAVLSVSIKRQSLER